jgi:hypothetical protein
MSESNSTESNKDDLSKSELLVVFGVIMPITLSASFLSYISKMDKYGYQNS